jgi:hypothetical protein
LADVRERVCELASLRTCFCGSGLMGALLKSESSVGRGN